MFFPVNEQLAAYKSQNNEIRAQQCQNKTQGVTAKTEIDHKGISVIILNLNAKELIIPLLEQLKQQQQIFSKQKLKLQILVGDTGSKDKDVLEYYDKHNFFTVIPELKYHFSKCNNHLATHYAHCSHLLFLNNDIIFDHNKPDSLFNLYNFSQQRMAGCIGSYLLFPDQTIQHAGVDFFRDINIRYLPYHIHARETIDINKMTDVTAIPAVTGAFLMLSHKLFNHCNGMSEEYQSECQDIDLCLKASRLGYSNYLINLGKIIHIENGTREKGEENWLDRQLFIRRWSSFINTTYL